MEMMTKKMSWLSRRTEVISQNVAHADTPNFKARDLKKVSFQDMVRKESQASGFTPQRTNSAHLVGLTSNMPFKAEKAPDSFETSIDENDVSIEQQLTKLGETQMSYQMTLNLYRKLSDVSAYGTNQRDYLREDFWLIVVTEGNADETEIADTSDRCGQGDQGHPPGNA